MLRLSALFLLFVQLLCAQTLQPLYFFEHRTITSTTLFPETEPSFTLFTFDEGSTRERVSTRDIVALFNEHGIDITPCDERYVTFLKKSPVDMSGLEQEIAAYFGENLPGIRLRSVTVYPRSYTETLPTEYKLSIAPKTFYRNTGTFHITDPHGQKLFFDFLVDAEITLLYARENIPRHTAITPFNSYAKTEPFIKINVPPLPPVLIDPIRSTRTIRPDRLLTTRMAEPLPLVKRRESVVVEIKSGAVRVSFSAKALQDGALHDIISIEKRDGERLRAKVTGPNRVEIE